VSAGVDIATPGVEVAASRESTRRMPMRLIMQLREQYMNSGNTEELWDLSLFNSMDENTETRSKTRRRRRDLMSLL
jgi:hypothetical protein